MAVTFTATNAATSLSAGTSSTVSNNQNFAVGDYLVVLMAYDNSGGGGANPISSTPTITTTSGAFDANVSSQTGLNDPGAASAGVAARCLVFPVTAAITSGGSFTVSWSGSVVGLTMTVCKVSSAGITGYRTNSGATGTNFVASAAPAFTTPSVNATEGVLCWAAYEYGAAVGGDSDTTNGSWGGIAGANNGGATFAGMAAYVQGKVVNATGTQTWNPTASVASDWITGCVIFTETPIPAITQAAYGFYAEGTETGSTALAAQNTAPTIDVTSGDVAIQLRTRLQSTTAVAVSATDDFQLQWEKNASGVWSAPDTISNLTLFDHTGTSSGLNLGFGSDQVGQTFTSPGGNLVSATLRLSKTGSPTGLVYMSLYATDAGGLPTGVPLLTSPTTFTASSISPGLYTFSFPTKPRLANGKYAVAVTTDGVLDTSNNIGAQGESGSYAGGNGVRRSTVGVWSTLPGVNDLYFDVVLEQGLTVSSYNSVNLTDGALNATNGIRLTGGTGVSIGSVVSEDGLVDNVGWAGNNNMELVYSIQLKQADLTQGDTLRFRVLRNGVTDTMTYSSVPTISVTKTVAPPNTGTATVSWETAQAATGATPVEGPKQGTATGSYLETATSVGKRAPRGSSVVGNFVEAATAAGKKTQKGTSTVGNFAETTAAVGKRTPKATTTASWSFDTFKDTFDGTAGTLLTSYGPYNKVEQNPLTLDGAGNAYAPQGYGGVWLTTPLPPDSNVEIVFRLNDVTDVLLQLGFRVPTLTDQYQGYMLSVENGKLDLETPANYGTPVSVPVTWVTTKDYTLRAEFVGGKIVVKLDGIEVMNWTDPSPVLGRYVYLYSDSNFSGLFDRIRSLEAGTSAASGVRPVVAPKQGSATASHIWIPAAVGATPAVKPIPATGLIGWWDADDSSTVAPSSGAVAAWRDKSSVGLDLNPEGGATITGSRTINGRNALLFNSGWLGVGTYTRAQPVTISVVVQSDVVDSANRQVLGNWNTNPTLYTTGNLWNIYNGNNLATAKAVDLEPHVVTVRFDGANSALWVDRVLAAAGTMNSGGWDNLPFALGAGSPGSYFWQGLIAEVVFYDRVLTTPEQAQVENYLTSKWLPAAPMHFGSATTTWLKPLVDTVIYEEFDGPAGTKLSKSLGWSLIDPRIGNNGVGSLVLDGAGNAYAPESGGNWFNHPPGTGYFFETKFLYSTSDNARLWFTFRSAVMKNDGTGWINTGYWVEISNYSSAEGTPGLFMQRNRYYWSFPSAAYPFVGGQEYTFRFEFVDDNNISIKIDGVEVLTYYDPYPLLAPITSFYTDSYPLPDRYRYIKAESFGGNAIQAVGKMRSPARTQTVRYEYKVTAIGTPAAALEYLWSLNGYREEFDGPAGTSLTDLGWGLFSQYTGYTVGLVLDGNGSACASFDPNFGASYYVGGSVFPHRVSPSNFFETTFFFNDSNYSYIQFDFRGPIADFGYQSTYYVTAYRYAETATGPSFSTLSMGKASTAASGWPSITLPLLAFHDYTLSVFYVGGTIQVYLDGVLILSKVESQTLFGEYIGISSYSETVTNSYAGFVKTSPAGFRSMRIGAGVATGVAPVSGLGTASGDHSWATSANGAMTGALRSGSATVNAVYRTKPLFYDTFDGPAGTLLANREGLGPYSTYPSLKLDGLGGATIPALYVGSNAITVPIGSDSYIETMFTYGSTGTPTKSWYFRRADLITASNYTGYVTISPNAYYPPGGGQASGLYLWVSGATAKTVPVTWEPNRDYLIRIEMVGDTVTVLLDGVAVLQNTYLTVIERYGEYFSIYDYWDELGVYKWLKAGGGGATGKKPVFPANYGDALPISHTWTASATGYKFTRSNALHLGYDWILSANRNPVVAPTDLAGCVGWWDADDPASLTVVAGNKVSQWTNKGSGPTVVQATDTKRPLTKSTTANGRNVLTFSGAQSLQFASANSWLNVGNVTVFVVAWQTGAPTDYLGFVSVYQGAVADNTTANGFLVSTGVATANLDLWRSNIATASPGVGDTGMSVWGGQLSSDGWRRVYKDGVETGASQTVGTFGVADGLTLGARQLTNASFLIGSMAEVIIYNRVLDVAERRQVEDYLYFKWMSLKQEAVADPISFAFDMPPAVGVRPNVGYSNATVGWVNQVTAAGPAINPLSIPWYASFWASDPSWTPPASGAATQSWRNSGSSSVDPTHPAAIQNTVAKQPIFQSAYAALNSRPALTFNGTSHSMFADTVVAIPQGNHIFVVGWLDATRPSASTMVDGATGTRHLFRNLGDAGGAVVWSSAGPNIVGAGRTGPFAMFGVFNNATSGVRSNGITYTHSTTIGVTTYADIWIGSDAAGSATTYMKGAIAFIGVSDEMLTERQVQDLEQWAKEYYSIPVVSSEVWVGSVATIGVSGGVAESWMWTSGTPLLRTIGVEGVSGQFDLGYVWGKADRPATLAVTAVSELWNAEAPKSLTARSLQYLTPTTGTVTTPDPGLFPPDFHILARIRGPYLKEAAALISDIAGVWEGDTRWLLHRNEMITSGAFTMYQYKMASAGGANRTYVSTVAFDDRNKDVLVHYKYKVNAPNENYEFLISLDEGLTWGSLGQGVNTSNYPILGSTGALATMRIGGQNASFSNAFDGRIYWVEAREGQIPGQGTLLWRYDSDDIPVTRWSWTFANDSNGDGIADGWEPYEYLTAQHSFSVVNGAQRIAVTAPSPTAAGVGVTGPSFPATQGAYGVRFSVRFGFTNSNAPSYVTMVPYDINGVQLAVQSVAFNLNYTLDPTVERGYTYTLPAGTASARLRIWYNIATTNNAGDPWFDIYWVEVASLSNTVQPALNYTDPRGRTWSVTNAAAITSNAPEWAETTIRIGVAGQSDLFVAGPTEWVGSLVEIAVDGQSNDWLSGLLWLNGSIARAGVSGISGVLVPGSTTWTGSLATASAAAQSGAFIAAPVTWAGGAIATVGVAGQSGALLADVAFWTGSTGTIGISSLSAPLLPGVATWAGSTAAMGVAATSAAILPGVVTWAGSTATAGVAGQTGTMSAGALIWTGSIATAGVAALSESFVPGAVSWTGSTATAGVAGTSGTMVGGPTTWTGSIASIGTSSDPSVWFAGQGMDGSTAQVGVSGISGVWPPGGPTIWTGGSIATAGVAGQSSTFISPPVTWVGSTATTGMAGQSGTFVGGATTWVGGTIATAGVAATTGAFTSLFLWPGSTATAGIAGTSGTLTGGPTTWTGGSIATAGVAAISAPFVGGAFVWSGSTASAGVSGVSSTFTPGLTAWAGSTATAGIRGISAAFLGGLVVWTGGSIATAGVAGQTRLFAAGASPPWVGSLAQFGLAGESGLFKESGIRGYWNGEEVVAMQYGDKMVFDWYMVPS